ncbi:MAG: nuclear transport factor 2 family protein [Myxococcota bacterium]|nr:hypothetical protein [Deltaproteobacteria bacterium]MDQ3338080.1 nuclear transport factor 2 family protein [Myxococcota bacterium]
MRRLLLIALLAGCPKKQVKDAPPLADNTAVVDRDGRVAIIAELKSEILTSYERDDPPEIESSMISPQVGTIRVGVGPGDVLVSDELERAPSRWPLDVTPATPTEARSKKLEIHLAQDATAAWAYDEVSWRIKTCGRTAVIPLRMTSLFARDGDRWVLVFEHLSFGRAPAPVRDGTLRGRTLKDARIDPDVHDSLSRVLAPVLTRSISKTPSAVSTGPEALIVGPDIIDEWQGPEMLGARVAAGNLRAEDRRVGVVGRRVETATMAYWVGNFVADLPARPGVAAGKVRFRGTFVFEKRRENKAKNKAAESCSKRLSVAEEEANPCRWIVVQGHISQSIDDGPDPDLMKRDYLDLASVVFGTSLISPKPLELTCEMPQ